MSKYIFLNKTSENHICTSNYLCHTSCLLWCIHAHMHIISAIFCVPVKRGRGRPRRYPPPGSANQVPTFIIPQSSGQAVVMKPVQVQHTLMIMIHR